MKNKEKISLKKSFKEIKDEYDKSGSLSEESDDKLYDLMEAVNYLLDLSYYDAELYDLRADIFELLYDINASQETFDFDEMYDSDEEEDDYDLDLDLDEENDYDLDLDEENDYDLDLDEENDYDLDLDEEENYTDNMSFISRSYGAYGYLNDIESDTQKTKRESTVKLTVRLTNIVLSKERLVVAEGIVYRYIVGDGYYSALSDSSLNYLIMSCISEEDRNLISKKIMNEIQERIKCIPELKRSIDDFNANPLQLNCKNKIVEIEPVYGEITLHDHTPDIMFNYVIDAEYREEDEREEPKNFNKYCETSFADDPQDKKRLLLEQLGYVLSDSMSGKCLLLGIGSANGGKSVVAKFVEKLFPPENICSIAAHDISSEFARARLLGKKLNILAEMSSRKLKGIDILKSITSGDTISAAFKGKDGFEFHVKTKLWYFANNFPTPAEIDPSDGFYNRLVPLIFSTSIKPEDQDKHLLEKLWQERNTIVSEAIDALLNLAHQNYKFHLPKDSQDFLDAYKTDMNSAQTFIDDCLIIAPDQKVHSKDLFSQYKIYCQENGLEVMPEREVRIQLKTISGIKAIKFSKNGENRRGYVGIGLKKTYK